MTLDEILHVVCQRHNATPLMLRGKHKPPKLAAARAEFAWLGHEAGFSYPMLGRFLNKDHTTLLLAARRHGLKRELKAERKVNGGDW